MVPANLYLCFVVTAANSKQRYCQFKKHLCSVGFGTQIQLDSCKCTYILCQLLYLPAMLCFYICVFVILSD